MATTAAVSAAQTQFDLVSDPVSSAGTVAVVDGEDPGGGAIGAVSTCGAGDEEIGEDAGVARVEGSGASVSGCGGADTAADCGTDADRVAVAAGDGATVGAARGTGVGEGDACAGGSGLMMRGATGTGPSVSTGPCARWSGDEVAEGGNWKSRAACAASGAGDSSTQTTRNEKGRIMGGRCGDGAKGVNRP